MTVDLHDKPASIDGKLFRRVMGRFATGVTILPAEAEGGVRGMTANAFMSASLAPPLRHSAMNSAIWALD